MAKASNEVKAASNSAALTGALSGAGTGAAIGSAIAPGVGTAIGAGAGLLIGGVASYLVTRSAAQNAEDDMKSLEAEQERLAKRAATEQRQLSKELASQASKQKTPTYQPPSSIMLEAVGSGSGYDAWHNRTF